MKEKDSLMIFSMKERKEHKNYISYLCVCVCINIYRDIKETKENILFVK